MIPIVLDMVFISPSNKSTNCRPQVPMVLKRSITGYLHMASMFTVWHVLRHWTGWKWKQRYKKWKRCWIQWVIQITKNKEKPKTRPTSSLDLSRLEARANWWFGRSHHKLERARFLGRTHRSCTSYYHVSKPNPRPSRHVPSFREETRSIYSSQYPILETSSRGSFLQHHNNSNLYTWAL